MSKVSTVMNCKVLRDNNSDKANKYKSQVSEKLLVNLPPTMLSQFSKNNLTIKLKQVDNKETKGSPHLPKPLSVPTTRFPFNLKTTGQSPNKINLPMMVNQVENKQDNINNNNTKMEANTVDSLSMV